MFKSVIFALSLMLGATAWANLNYDPNGPTEDQVKAAKAQLEPAIFSVAGVNGLGITACDARTGIPFYVAEKTQMPTSGLYVNCLEISTSTTDAVPLVRALFPESKYLGIFVYVLYVGKIVAL